MAPSWRAQPKRCMRLRPVVTTLILTVISAAVYCLTVVYSQSNWTTRQQLHNGRSTSEYTPLIALAAANVSSESSINDETIKCGSSTSKLGDGGSIHRSHVQPGFEITIVTKDGEISTGGLCSSMKRVKTIGSMIDADSVDPDSPPLVDGVFLPDGFRSSFPPVTATERSRSSLLPGKDLEKEEKSITATPGVERTDHHVHGRRSENNELLLPTVSQEPTERYSPRHHVVGHSDSNQTNEAKEKTALAARNDLNSSISIYNDSAEEKKIPANVEAATARIDDEDDDHHHFRRVGAGVGDRDGHGEVPRVNVSQFVNQRDDDGGDHGIDQSDVFTGGSIVGESEDLLGEIPIAERQVVKTEIGKDYDEDFDKDFENEDAAGDDVSGKCELTRGRWVRVRQKPPYTENGCSYIPRKWMCRSIGKKHFGYLQWRWKPDDCDSPQFEAEKFLELFRNKTITFVGDSILRNLFTSLLCLLSSSQLIEPPIWPPFKNPFYQLYVPKYGVTMLFGSANFLVKESERLEDFKALNVTKQRLESFIVHVDSISKALGHAVLASDLIVLGAGHWFDATQKYKVYVRNGSLVRDEDDDRVLFEEAMVTVRDSILASDFRGAVYVQSYTPAHNSRRGCNAETQPLSDVEATKWAVKSIANNYLEIQRQVFGASGVFRLLDITHVSMFRSDAHIGWYRRRRKPDCMHWCLPGVPDTWNEIFYRKLRSDKKMIHGLLNRTDRHR